jgi:flavin reductase (DIM6/NTAB) family NADH-FMN oxidoreductase RutF/Arc/MetJ-type ribon-helix-helix transcriptional regulator
MSGYDIALENKDINLFCDTFRRACSHIPTGVAILAGLDAQQRPFGLTVSSTTCVSFAPPLVSVCIGRGSPSVEQIRQSGRFSVNLLRYDQAELATLFAAPGIDRFQELRWRVSEFGPVLNGTLGALFCEFTKDVETGDHQLILGEVKRLVLHGAGDPLVYWRRAFHRLHLHYPFIESEQLLEEFLRLWEAGTLSRSCWTHSAHVAVAAYYAFDYPQETAFQMTKSGILHFNVCVGTANTEDSGYHETLTRFWAGVVGGFVRSGQFPSRLEAVRNAVRQFGEDRDRHRLHYSFDVVRDRRARREWIQPDRESALHSCEAC